MKLDICQTLVNGGVMHVHIGKIKIQADTYRAASEIWKAYRDVNWLGISNSPRVVVMEGDKKLATVSYNGRVWDNDGKEITL